MRLFISYSSSRAELCERLRLALEAEGHIVFADRADLRAGEEYNETLREAIQDADVFIFLISPESVAYGSYTLAELSIAEQQWRAPAGHVLPVVVAPTDMASIPPYLRAVTLLQPRGELVAETVAAVARMRPRRMKLRLAVAAAALAVIAIGGFVAYEQHESAQRAERAEQEAARQALEQARRAQTERAVASAMQLCDAGNFAIAWQQLATQDAPRARERCGMQWLRVARVTEGRQTFSELADRIQPVLAAGLATSSGQQAADLRAHIGWADFLRSRDGVSAPDPVAQYQRALEDDPNNTYAHAMWGHWLMWQSPPSVEAAARHFADALKDKRDLDYVRNLQLAAYYNRPALWPRTLPVVDQMRLAKQNVPAEMRSRLFRNVLVSGLADPGSREAVLAALPPNALLATFEWLAPAEGDRSENWQVDFSHAVLQANAGQVASARAGLEALRATLREQKASGRIVDETDRLLKRLSGSPP